MDSSLDTVPKADEEQGREKIKRLQDKINTTEYNLEVSNQIISETPSDTQQEKLIRKNKQRQHGIAGLKQEIRDIELSMED